MSGLIRAKPGRTYYEEDPYSGEVKKIEFKDRTTKNYKHLFIKFIIDMDSTILVKMKKESGEYFAYLPIIMRHTGSNNKIDFVEVFKDEGLDEPVKKSRIKARLIKAGVILKDKYGDFYLNPAVGYYGEAIKEDLYKLFLDINYHTYGINNPLLEKHLPNN